MNQTNDLAAAVMARIDGAIIDLLPEDKLRDMIEAEITRFTQERTEKRGYDSVHVVPSPLSSLLNARVQEHMLKIIDAEWQGAGDRSNGYVSVFNKVLNAAVKDALEKNGSEILANFLTAFLRGSMNFGAGQTAIQEIVKRELQIAGFVR